MGVLSEVYLFFEKIKERDMDFDKILWSDSCDGMEYTQEELDFFCESCLNGSEKCNWPLDIYLSINKLERIRKRGDSVHCYFIMDGVNEYHVGGKYYGVTESPFFTWYVLDARENHEIQFCCGIERNTFLYSLLGVEKKWPQSCIQKEVNKKCV